MKLAIVIAGKSPVAVQGTKELLNVGRDKPVDESMFIFISNFLVLLFFFCLPYFSDAKDNQLFHLH